MWKKFFLSTIGTFMILCASSIAINLAVDPYNIYQRERTIGFNYFAVDAENHERLFKSIALINRKPSIVVLGNSKADFAIDPQLFGTNAYNAAVRNAQPRELLAFARAAARNNPKLERIILAVDFEMFLDRRESMPGFDPDQLDSDRITVENIFRTSLSTDALEASARTLELNRLYERDFLAFDPDGKFSEPALYELFTFENSFHHNSIAMTKLPPLDPEVLKRKLDAIQSIVELCREHSIQLTLMILPVHRSHSDRYPKTDYQLWRKKIAGIAPVEDFSSISIIDSTNDFWDAAHVKATAFEHYICAMLK